MKIDLNAHGPHTPESTKEAAAAAAEAVRVLNHATQDGGLEAPDVYDILGSLSAAAHSLPQLLRQLHAHLEGEAAAGRIGQDDGAADDLDTALRRTGTALSGASAAAEDLGRHLNDARESTSRMHSRRGEGPRDA